MQDIFGFFSKSNKAEENKDTQDKTLVVNKNRCPQNHLCPSIRVCPTGALKQSGYAAPTVDMSKCVKCGKCVRYCPMRAISLR
jgi:ferredoxin